MTAALLDDEARWACPACRRPMQMNAADLGQGDSLYSCRECSLLCLIRVVAVPRDLLPAASA